MAQEVLLSPGVLARENDQSQITKQPVQAGAAIIGPTVKGPVGIPTIVTSYSEYVGRFGTTFTSASSVYSFLTSLSAYNYFSNGGKSLLVTRVTAGDYTAASSSAVTETDLTGSAFELKTLSHGALMNSTGSEDANGGLTNGNEDNIRWEIVSADTSSGTFSLLIRRGNDRRNEKVILESFTNLSLDPKANNYISKVIGDTYKTIVTDADNTTYVKTVGTYPNKSNYVYVSSVNSKTPDYFDNTGTAKSAYTGSIPINQSGSFGGGTGLTVENDAALYEKIITGTNIQGIDQSRYTQSIALLNNPIEYQFNLITAPGLIMGKATTAITSLITMVEERGDAVAIVDNDIFGASITSMVTNAATYNSSYAATYAPWVQITSPETGELIYIPPSTIVPGVFAYTDNVSEPWFAPAGISRGGLDNVIQTERKLTEAQKNTLYQGKINPIATLPGTGIAVFGQKTLQKKASALDRINVRRLLIETKSYIKQIGDTLVFEQNTVATRNTFLSKVNPYLDSIKQRQGLYKFYVQMDDTNNDADAIDRNELRGAIYLQPTKTSEFIYLDFNIMSTGTEFPV